MSESSKVLHCEVVSLIEMPGFGVVATWGNGDRTRVKVHVPLGATKADVVRAVEAAVRDGTARGEAWWRAVLDLLIEAELSRPHGPAMGALWKHTREALSA